MRFPRYLDPDDVPSLEYEVVSQDLRIYLTRELDHRVSDDVGPDVEIARQNVIVNKSRALAGLPVYVLEGDLDAYYETAEFAWHSGEFQLAIRRLTTIQLAEFLGELIEDEWFSVAEVNGWLERDEASFYYQQTSSGLRAVVMPIAELEGSERQYGHPNLRVLIARMDTALAAEDYSAVLHASASVFETMAKDIIGIPTVQNQTLKSFFDRYRKESSLPGPLLDYIIEIYDARNTTPLAGHGSLRAPDIGREEAITLVEMAKAFVRIEYSLHQEPSLRP